MNKLSFKILPSPETNDHEVRILVDGQDFLGDNYLGLDPTSFFEQDFDKEGTLCIGRCTCGVEGCDDFTVNVSFNENSVSWTDSKQLDLLFDKTEYINLIIRAKNNHSWEDINRKVERITTDILKNSQTKNGYKFDWASARIHDKQITLSYSKDSDQKLFHIPWDGQSEKNVKQNTAQFLKEKLK